MNTVTVTTTETSVVVSETSATVNVTAGQDTVLVNPPDMAYMCAFDLTTQTASSATTAYKITHDTTDGHYALTNNNGTFTFERRGTYLINFSVQFENTSTADVDTNIFAKKNGQVFSNTNSRTTVPSKHGQTSGSAITAVSFLMFFDVNDTFELWWQSDNSATKISKYAAIASPEIPVTPSIITTIVQVS